MRLASKDKQACSEKRLLSEPVAELDIYFVEGVDDCASGVIIDGMQRFHLRGLDPDVLKVKFRL